MGSPALEAELAGARGALALEVSLRAEPGACLALAGPSGAGKTSVLRALAGLWRPQDGRVRLGDETWLDTGRGVDVPPERRRCGVVFQDYALFGHLSAWRNVAYGLRGSRSTRRARALELLERFGLAARADARPASLSGGERQRVALARALAAGPSSLLLDEPLAALDASTRPAAAAVLAGVLRETAVPSVLVTHDFEEAALLAARVAVIDGGRIVQEGTPAELAAAPASAFVARFTGASVLLGTARRAEGGLTRVALDGGGEVVAVDAAAGPVAVTVHPWDVALEPSGEARHGSAQNRLAAEVLTVTEVGSRARVGLAAPQPLAAEVTVASARALGLRPGAQVVATWKAAATRVVAR